MSPAGDSSINAVIAFARNDERQRIQIALRGVRASLSTEYPADLVDKICERISPVIGGPIPIPPTLAIEGSRGRHAAPEEDEEPDHAASSAFPPFTRTMSPPPPVAAIEPVVRIASSTPTATEDDPKEKKRGFRWR